MNRIDERGEEQSAQTEATINHLLDEAKEGRLFDDANTEPIASLRPAPYCRLLQKLEQECDLKVKGKLDDIRREAKNGKDDHHSSADMLMTEINDLVRPLRSRGRPYIIVKDGDRTRVWSLPSEAFKNWALKFYHDTTGHVLPKNEVDNVVGVLQAEAQDDGRRVFFRSGEMNGHLYLDLANEQDEVVEITAGGWGIKKNPGVLFVRTDTMRSLPHPEPGGSILEGRRSA